MSTTSTVRAVGFLVAALLLVVGCRSTGTSSPLAWSGASDPALAGLDPDLLGALLAARADAADDGVRIEVNSGWRSREHQAELFERAVEKYGSEEAAARWVARPGTSVHEAGGAVDVGPDEAVRWLAEHGAAYGLCQVYANEPWHYELRPAAARHGCPATYADPTRDPRMQQ